MFDTANFADSDIIFVGQIHGSPERHLLQAQIIEIVDPTTVGFEMLNSEQTALVIQANLSDPKLGEILG